MTPKRLNNGFVTILLHLMCSCLFAEGMGKCLWVVCSLLEMFSRESDEKFWVIFVLSSTSTKRGFATGTLCANNVHGANLLKDGMIKGDACIPLICLFFWFFFLITPVVHLEVGKSFHAFLRRRKPEGLRLPEPACFLCVQTSTRKTVGEIYDNTW